MDRSQVYDVLNSERDYQDKMVSPETHHLGKPSVSEELLMMEHYLEEARTKWVTTKGDDACLDIMRKVAGIAVRCFENHGCPRRQMPEL